MSLPGYGSLEVSCKVGKPCMEVHIHELIGFISSLLQLMYQVTKLHKALAEKVLFCSTLILYLLYASAFCFAVHLHSFSFPFLVWFGFCFIFVCFFWLLLVFVLLFLPRLRICLLIFLNCISCMFFFVSLAPSKKFYIISLSLETNSKTSRFV